MAVSARPLRAPCVERKYSSTDSPSRNEERIGSSMMPPDGSAIRPRIPDIWVICWMFPFAPDWAIIVIGPNGSRAEPTALVTSSFVRVQIAMTSLYRSSLVMRPRLNCFWTLATSASACASRSCFVSGMVMSVTATVVPDCVA
jgi:hypothetical protein